MLLTFPPHLEPKTMWLLPLVAQTDTFFSFFFHSVSVQDKTPISKHLYDLKSFLNLLWKYSATPQPYIAFTMSVCLSVCVCVFVQISVRALWALDQLQIISKQFFGMLLTFSTNFHPYTMWLLPLVAWTDTFFLLFVHGVSVWTKAPISKPLYYSKSFLNLLWEYSETPPPWTAFTLSVCLCL